MKEGWESCSYMHQLIRLFLDAKKRIFMKTSLRLRSGAQMMMLWRVGQLVIFRFSREFFLNMLIFVYHLVIIVGNSENFSSIARGCSLFWVNHVNLCVCVWFFVFIFTFFSIFVSKWPIYLNCVARSDEKKKTYHLPPI